MDKEINDFLLTEKSIKNGEKYRRNLKWLDENFEEERKEYPGKIAIVLDQKIWDTAETPSEVHNKLGELPRGRQLQAYIEYLPEEDEKYY